MTWPTQPQPGASDNYDSLLGGRSTPSASFKGQFPIRWSGFVEEASKKPAYAWDPSKPGNRGAQKFWDDGNPVENLWITLRTEVRDPNIQDDNGYRVLVLDSKNKVDAVQQAVRESGASFAKNGYLDIEWYGVDPAGKNPDNPPKLYRARYQGPTLDAALGQAGPPTSAASAPQANWGGQAPAVSAPPATGGWGNPPQAAAQPSWGQPATPAQAQYATPSAPVPDAPGNGWGAPAAAAAVAPPVAPVPAPTVTADPVDPNLAEALRRKGVNLPGDATMQTALGIWAIVEHNPDVA